jgi:DNA-binding NtrC family response regulator
MSRTYEFLGLRAVIESQPMSALLEKARRFALSDAPVLIQGESGSGKEVAARALHHFSMRCAQPWVDISCAALPEHLVESELFGHEKGAFSGAESRKEGLFELAHNGTLFLDEVGELEPRLQVKLLRVLDCGSYYRLGGTRKVQVNVRVVAATNRDLTAEIAGGGFRKDLFHRLSGLQLSVPPLRERRADILPIAGLLLETAAPASRWSAEAEQALVAYDWPGNVRELRNVVSASLALADGSVIELADLPPAVQAAISPSLDLARASLAVSGLMEGGGAEGGGLLQHAERQLIFTVLRDTDGHQERAARILGISSRTLSRKLKEYGAA